MSDHPSRNADKADAKSWISRLIHTFQNHDVENEKELIEALQSAETNKLIDHDAMNMIEGVLDVSKMTVSDIMIPRSQMVTLERGKHLSEILPIIIESTHSRFPVIEENKDTVLGILLAKDLLKYFARHEIEDPILEVHFLRPAVFIPESKRLDSLLNEFRLSHNHLAIVVDEYGNVSGVVTIEDVLELIVGNIEDEFDKEENPMIKSKGNKTFEVNALTLIEDFNEYFQTSFSDDRVDTIGGLIMEHCGYLPKSDESFTINEYTFHVTDANTRQLKTFLVVPNNG